MTSELLAISYELLQAIRTRDRARLERLLTADFVHVNELGHRQSRDSFLAGVAANEYAIEQLAFETISTEEFGTVGVVCGVQHAIVRVPTGDEVQGRAAFTDVFVRTASGWQLRFATSAELETRGLDEPAVIETPPPDIR